MNTTLITTLFILIFIAAIMAAYETIVLSTLFPSKAWKIKVIGMVFIMLAQIGGVFNLLTRTPHLTWKNYLYPVCILGGLVCINIFNHLLRNDYKNLSVKFKHAVREKVAAAIVK